MIPTYLDCNATTPMEPAVRELVLRFLDEEFGNAGSRTHEFGSRAKRAVQRARDQVASVVGAKRDEVLFTSGATESNNLAILGLAAHGEARGRKHVVTTALEHKAVLEPVQWLEERGFVVERVAPDETGRVSADDVLGRVRDDTLLVSVMHVNNETGVEQPLGEIADALVGHDAYLHTDAAQGFGKVLDVLRDPRIDLISVSGHKVYGPKGVGALVARRRGFRRAPLQPLMVGGGQERGLRPGTIPVPQVVGLGLAAEIAERDHERRREANAVFRARLLEQLEPLGPVFNGDPDHTLPHTINLSFPGVDAEAAMVAVKEVVAVSNGSACTSHEYRPSHVLEAMGLSPDRVRQAIRISWCHLTPEPDWDALVQALRRVVRAPRTAV